MAWIYVFIAGMLEVGWAIGLKYTDGLRRGGIGASILTVILMILSLAVLAQALRTLPVGTGYAVWTGIGAIGTAVLGIVLFGESTNPWRLACLGLIIVGIVGLKLLSPD